MKRQIAILCTASMLALSLIGCGGNKPAETKAPETKATEAAPNQGAETQPAAEDGKIEINGDITINLWDIATTEPTEKLYNIATDNFTKDYPNVTVVANHIANDTYKQKLLIAMSANQCPDMYIHWTGGPMNEYYKSGFCDDIGPLFEQYNETPYLESAISMCTADDGTLIALPYGGMSGAFFYYNKTIFEECGLDVPTTIDELEECCEVLLEHDVTPFAVANGSKWTGSLYYMNVASRYGGNTAVQKAYTGEGSFTDEPFVKAAAKIQEWVEKGYFNEGCNSIKADEGQDKQLMYTGDCAMLCHLSSISGGMLSDNADWYHENIGAFKFPVDAESEKAGIDQTVAVGSAVGNAFSFNSKGDDELLKAMFVYANTYWANDDYTHQMLEINNKIASVQGMDALITDPVVKVSWDVFADASSVQLFYDQYLPGEVAEVHKDTMSDLFGLTDTPENICQKLQDALVAYKEANK